MQLYNKNIKKTKYVKCLIKDRIKCIEELKRKKVPMKRPLDTGKIYCEQYAVSFKAIILFCFILFYISFIIYSKNKKYFYIYILIFFLFVYLFCFVLFITLGSWILYIWKRMYKNSQSRCNFG